MHIVAQKSYGIPQNSRDAFDLLQANGFISQELCNKLKAMVGFRNIAVHDYQNINIYIVQKVIDCHLDDIKEFAVLVMKD